MWRRLWYLLRHRQLDAELAEEIETHRAMAQAAREAEGLPPDTAAHAARRALGNDLSARARARDEWMTPWLQDLGQDVRLALRRLVHERTFTIAAVAALGLGIGANTTVFTLVNAISLRGLPVAHPERIVALYAADAAGRRVGLSRPELDDWQDATNSFEGVAGIRGATFNVGDADRLPERVTGAYVSWNAFPLLGDRPLLGRLFVDADDRPGAAPVVLLGYRVWQSRYAGDPGIVGRGIVVDGGPATVVGVMREGVQFPALADAWRPLAAAPGVVAEDRNLRALRAFGRLRPGVDERAAAAELNAIAARLAADHPDSNAGIGAGVEPFTGRVDQPFLLAMFVAVAFVLLIACANVASLLLARAAYRGREMALRAMLGASRWRLARQLLVESAIAAACAGALGLLLAKAGMQFFVGDTDASALAYWIRWSMDLRVFGFLAGVSLATLVLFGVGPALYLSRGAGTGVLTADGRMGGGARRSTSVLLAAELALTLVLLAGAVLMVRSLAAMQARDRAIETAHVLTAALTPAERKYPTRERREQFIEQLEARLRAVRMLSRSALATHVPFVGAPVRQLILDGADAASSPRSTVATIGVGERYFETLGLPILEGRAFTARDGRPGQDTVIVNRAFVTRFLGGAQALGRRIRLTTADRGDEVAAWHTIVGVVPTVRQQPQQQVVDAVAYLPLRTAVGAGPASSISLLVRSDADPGALANVLREELRGVDSDLALGPIVPLDEHLRRSQWTHRLFSRIFTVFAAVAMTLSMVGLYALTAYMVGRRTREIGVRVALGAQRRDVVSLFVARTVVQLGIGLLAGGAGAVGLGMLLRGLLVDTSQADPRTLALAAGVLALAAIGATVGPVRRATRLDPVAALRHD